MQAHLPSLVLLLSMLAHAHAYAQEQTPAERRAAARALFAEGVAFAQDEQWTEAADRFRRTMDLHPTPVVAFNLATAQAELGHLVEAAENLRMTHRFPGAEDDVLREADALLAEIEPKIAQLRISIRSLPTGAHVERDGTPLTRAQLGVDLPMDPGTHTIRLIRGGEVVDERTVDLAWGSSEVVDLGLGTDISPGVAAATVNPARSENAEPGTSSSSGVVEQWWFWTLVGVVIVGAAVGIGVGIAGTDGGQSEPIAGDLDPPTLRGMVVSP